MYTAAKLHGEKVREKILSFIVEYIKKSQYAPTINEIGYGVGLKSKASVVNHLIKLREEGKINYLDYQPRTITVPGYKFVSENEIEITNSTCRYWNSEHKDCAFNYEKIRNKAIDDVREKLMQNGFIYTQHALDVFDDMAEQLKAGGENA